MTTRYAKGFPYRVDAYFEYEPEDSTSRFPTFDEMVEESMSEAHWWMSAALANRVYDRTLYQYESLKEIPMYFFCHNGYYYALYPSDLSGEEPETFEVRASTKDEFEAADVT